MNTPITEADLHAYVDGQLTAQRQREIDAYIDLRPEEASRVASFRAQKQDLRALFDPVLDEALPPRLLRAVRPTTPWYMQRMAASILVAAISATSAWFVRGTVDDYRTRSIAVATAIKSPSMASVGSEALTGFARRAAVAHVVYSPDVRRPVEVGADQEQQLVTWLSKRLGTEVKPPSLQAIGYELIGGRLLPGDSGPVAQFMYHDKIGQRLTLYVTREPLTKRRSKNTRLPSV